jgi:Mor family transcriptional regulator
VATPENTGVEDFPENSLPRFVAEYDIELALAVCSKFGGLEEYIQKRDTIDRVVVHRFIISRVEKMETARTIARSVNLGVSQVARIIRRHLSEEVADKSEHTPEMNVLLKQIK